MVEELDSAMERLTTDLRLLNERLQSESSGSIGSLADFREVLDAIRLTAWTVHELSRARHGEEHSKEVLVLTANERTRRFGDMAVRLCSDLDSGILRRDSARDALLVRIDALRERLEQVERGTAA
jgi:hypothetical protein